MQAIVTKYFGPSLTRGARISVISAISRRIIPYDHALDAHENHAMAARQMADRLGWNARMVSGALPDGTYAHCFDWSAT